MVALIAFWLAAGIVIYVYAGYPLVLLLLRGLMGRPAPRPPCTTTELATAPTVSLVVPAYNEAEFIGAKLRNSLALDYPADRLEIVVASDGSRDGTTEIVRRFTDDPRVRLCDYPQNRGKLYVINDTIPLLTGEIVAFSDASSMLDKHAMRRLLAHFVDPHVGAVSGVYKVTERDQARHGIEEDFYWRYETFLKLQESAIGSILGCHGSLYAIRKDLYPFPDPRTINDDYVIPLRILQRGYRIAYEPAAVAAEEAKQMGGFSRRIRIMAGNFRQLQELTALLRPFRPLELFFFFSHKVGRLLVPWALIVMFCANFRLLDRPFFQWTLAAQLGFYALAVAGAIWPLWPDVLRLPYFFCMINVASFLGLFSAVSGRSEVAWRRQSPPLLSAAGDPDSRSAP
jgi:cellulose synthase/poly-beta-1,6-N-acetylglucosamine synthase-like glycosyltransferase